MTIELEMKPDRSFLNAFNRAVARFPAAAVSVETGQGTLTPDGFCAASADPPIVVLTFPKCAGVLPGPRFSVGTRAAKEEGGSVASLQCVVLEKRELGDHWMLLASVRRLEITGGTPLVSWGRDLPIASDSPFPPKP